MKKILLLSALALLALSAGARANDGPGCTGKSCKEPRCVTPDPYCPDCGDPCAHRMNLAVFGHGDHVQKLIEKLCSGCPEERKHAAHKLGSRLHANICCQPEVVPALVKALQCDTCFEVRETAAWALAYQGARTRLAVLALYLSSKLDPNYLVRIAAGEALDVLLVCRRDCFKDLFAAGDALAKKLKGKYQPTQGSCVELTEECLAVVGTAADPIIAAPAGPVTMPSTPVIVPGTPAILPAPPVVVPGTPITGPSPLPPGIPEVVPAPK